MDRLPNLKALLAFRYAGEEKSFKKAAERLNVSQAAVSQSIRALEDQLGLRLFIRLTREVELTNEGHRLLSHASSAFSTLERGVAELTQDPHPNQLTISTIPSFASRWLIPKLGGFQSAEPGLTVNVSPSVELVSFEGGEPDVAIRLGKGHYQGLEAKKLFDEFLIPVCHPGLIDSGKPSGIQLTNMRLLTDESADLRHTWQEFEEASGVAFNHQLPGLNVTDAGMLVEAALSGQGLALIRFSLVSELLRRGQLFCPLAVRLKSRYDYYLVAPPAHLRRPKVKRFERWLVSEFGQLTQEWEAFWKTIQNA